MISKNINSKNLSIKIKKKRIYYNYSQVKLSKLLNISPSYLNLIESGKRDITKKIFNKLCIILNLSLSDILSSENRKKLSLLTQIFKNNDLKKININNSDINDMINNNPKIAEAIIILFGNEKKYNQKKTLIKLKTERYISERYGLVLRKSPEKVSNYIYNFLQYLHFYYQQTLLILSY